MQALARQKDGVSALLDDPPTLRVTYEKKNALNNMSAEYAKAQRIMDTTDTAVLKAAKELVLSVPSSIGGDE